MRGSQLKAVVVLSQGLANEWCRHSHVEAAGCWARTLCHSAGPATGLEDSVVAPERSQVGSASPDASRSG